MAVLFCSIYQKKLLRISASASQNMSTLYVATARYDFCMSTFIDLCWWVEIKVWCTLCILLWQDIESNKIASYHEKLPEMTTKHSKKRGEIRTWKNGRVFVLGWENFWAKYKIKESDSCLCEIVLHQEKAIEMIRVHLVRKVRNEWRKEGTLF